MKRPSVIGRDFHARRRLATARGGEHALAFHFHHARAAVPVGPHPFLVTKMRNLDTIALCHLNDGLVAVGDDVFAVQLERNSHRFELFGGNRSHWISSGKYFMTHRIGFGAAWPRPQIEASAMAA